MMQGDLRKMVVEHGDPVSYQIPVGDGRFVISEYLGQPLKIRYLGTIHCIACNRVTAKSFAQGHCYPCFKRLAQCDMCIMKPETCHFHKGTCRDETWAQNHCMQPHIVYLANSSGLKVGITRADQMPTRWIDQGATQALPIAQVSSRLHSGLLENLFREFVNDRTDWRRMLKGPAELLDMNQEAERLFDLAAQPLQQLSASQPSLHWQRLDLPDLTFNYPVLVYPQKVSSFNLDKTPQIEATLQGIKGQYLIFDRGVINIRKYSGYKVEISR